VTSNTDPGVWPADDASLDVTVTVSGTDAAAALEANLGALVSDKIASRITQGDPTLWGDAAVSEASIRLGWTTLADSSRPLVEPIETLRAELNGEGVDRVVLCGMGGSSLAPEVIAAEAGKPLVVLDGTDPGQVEAALVELERTVIVVSSKSGGTVETDSQRRTFEAAFTKAGIDAKSRIVVVTDPDSPLDKSANEAGYRAVFQADPTIGGRYSALTAFGLVPSGLAGVDIGALLDEAASVSGQLAEDSESNPGLILGAVLGGSRLGGDPEKPFRDKITFVDLGSGLPGFGDWVEQLIAESTGKEGTGLLPVVVHSPEAPEIRYPADDVLPVRLVAPGSEEGDDAPGSSAGASVSVSGPLGAQMLLWEYAIVVAGRLIGINPFDQPDVESAKKAARGLLDATPDPSPAEAVDGAVEIRATPGLLEGVTTVDEAVDKLLAQLPSRGYLAVMAYLNRESEGDLADVRDALARKGGRPVTFGWGPRFLHSTGQYHKGGPPIGVYLQITGDAGTDLEIPDRPFTFGKLIAAQAAGDAGVLAEHHRPVLRLHLTDRAAGLAQVKAALSR
jgi:glucose-6-phosphate isomerase